jgi:hypothetical protein
MAASVTAKPTSCSGESDWPRIVHPTTAPVTGPARPNNGGAAAGRRRIPLNQSMNANAVPIRLR